MNALDIDFHVDESTATIGVTAIIAKSLGENCVAEMLRLISRAFAETEAVSEEVMHDELEGVVEGLEDETDFKFVWTLRLKYPDPDYSHRLRKHLEKLLPASSIH